MGSDPLLIRKTTLCVLLSSVTLICSGCATSNHEIDNASVPASVSSSFESSTASAKGTRDNTPECLVPSASGTVVLGNASASVDASNSSDGYIMVQYKGSNSKIKLQIAGSDQVTYTYNLDPGGRQDTFPLSAGSGTCKISVYENISGNQYSTAFSTQIDVELSDPMLPFLYPNQYVMFDSSSTAVAKACELAAPADTDLDVVTAVYDYIIQNISYDYDEAENVQTDYLPDVDEILSTGKGICLDYASLMTAMLRSQKIPTRMEVGYAGTEYHAWISTYIKDIGWVNGIIEFNGNSWQLMDPTFASTTSASKLKSFTSNSDNYRLKYIY